MSSSSGSQTARQSGPNLPAPTMAEPQARGDGETPLPAASAESPVGLPATRLCQGPGTWTEVTGEHACDRSTLFLGNRRGTRIESPESVSGLKLVDNGTVFGVKRSLHSQERSRSHPGIGHCGRCGRWQRDLEARALDGRVDSSRSPSKRHRDPLCGGGQGAAWRLCCAPRGLGVAGGCVCQPAGDQRPRPVWGAGCAPLTAADIWL